VLKRVRNARLKCGWSVKHHRAARAASAAVREPRIAEIAADGLEAAVPDVLGDGDGLVLEEPGQRAWGHAVHRRDPRV